MHRRKNPFRPYGMTATAQNWNKSFTQIEHRHRRSSPRGSGALIPNPHSLLNIHFPLSMFKSSLLLILFRQGVNTCSRNYEETRLRYVTIQFHDRRGAAHAASLRYRNRSEITVLICERKPYLVWFSCPRKSYLEQCEQSLKTLSSLQ